MYPFCVQYEHIIVNNEVKVKHCILVKKPFGTKPAPAEHTEPNVYKLIEIRPGSR